MIEYSYSFNSILDVSKSVIDMIPITNTNISGVLLFAA